jgi:hypothetical protein
VLAEIGEQAGSRLHREVNLTPIPAAVWDQEEDLFVRTLKSRPLIPIPLTDPTVAGDPAQAGGEPS